MTLALVDLRLPIYLVIACVLLFGFAAWLSWEDDQADGAPKLEPVDELALRRRRRPLAPVDKEPWCKPRSWRG